MKIYLVWNLENDTVISANKTNSGARHALLDYLRTEVGYIEADWQKFTDDNGYDDIEEFQMAVLDCADYDEELEMMVEEIEVHD